MGIKLQSHHFITGFRNRLLLVTALVLLATSFAGVQSRQVHAAGPVSVDPPNGNLGTVFTMQAGGFAANEKVVFWTNTPNNRVIPAGYYYADQSGNIKVKLETTDHAGFTTILGTNYTEQKNITDANGNLIDRYLRIVLDLAAPGKWSLTASGTSTQVSQVFNFTIDGTPQPPTDTSVPIAHPLLVNNIAVPATGKLGTVFTIQATGFKPLEDVIFWTTGPDNKALVAGYTHADQSGNIKVVVDTGDPYQQAANLGANFVEQITVPGANGSVADQYLRIVLFNPTVGSWSITAHGKPTGMNQVFSFSVTP